MIQKNFRIGYLVSECLEQQRPWWNVLKTDLHRLVIENTSEILASLSHSQIHVLTKPRDVSDAYKNNTTFGYDGFVQALMRTFGCSKSCLEAMYSYSQHEPNENDFPNPNHKTLAKLMRDLHVKQLFPGGHLENLGNKFIDFFRDSLILEEVVKKWYATEKTSNSVVVPLHAWTSEMITLGGQRVYFGRLLEEIDPEMTGTFLEFDELSSQVLYQYPRSMSGRMHFLKEKLIQNFATYLGVPAEERRGDIWFTKAFEHEALQRAVGNQDLATMMTTTYWATNTNTRKACSWMISYIIFYPELIDIVRIETDRAFDNDGRVNFHYLNESCPRLSAIWNETIRLTTSSASVRHLSADTIIGGKILRKNNRVMIPYRQLHFNEEVFGKDVHRFDPDRFLKNEALQRSSSWRPFGGGITMCPGRFVAKQAVVTEVAMLLRRFDVELVEPGPFPRFEEGKPVLGIMSNKKGDDPLIRLRKRSTLC